MRWPASYSGDLCLLSLPINVNSEESKILGAKDPIEVVSRVKYYTSTKSWRGYIVTSVCLCGYVCVSVCVCVCNNNSLLTSIPCISALYV